MLIGYWKLDSDIQDSSGTGKHGTIYGATPAAGVIGGSYSFNGVDNEGRIQFPEIILENFSLSYWVKTPNTNLNCALNMRNSSYSGTTTMVGHRIAGYFSFRDQLGVSANCSLPAVVSNTWTHIFAKREASSTKLYINGLLYSTNDNPSLGSFNIGDISLGFDQYSGGRLYWNGMIDDIRLYDNALNNREIKWLAQPTKLSIKQDEEINKQKVLHFGFDEQPEPTENLVTNGGFVDDIIDWDISDSIEYILHNEYNKKENVLYLKRPINTSGYLGAINNKDIIAKPSTQYTQSIRYYLPKQLDKQIRLYSTEYDPNNNRTSFRHYITIDKNSPVGVWDVKTATFTSASNASYFTYFRVDWETTASTLQDDEIYIDFMQMEEKSYATPFVNGSRAGIIKDYAENNNIDLNINTAPTWTSDSIVGNGAYYFNQSSISIPFKNGIKTISFWRKSSYDGGPIIGYDSGNVPSGSSILFSPDITGSYGDESFLAYVGSDLQMYIRKGTNYYKDGKWHHFVIVFESGRNGIYVDGIAENVMFKFGDINTVTDIRPTTILLGQRHLDDSGSPYQHDNSIMTDFRIYSTGLSASDVQKISNINIKSQIDKNNMWVRSASPGQTTKLYKNGHLEYGPKFNKNIIDGL